MTMSLLTGIMVGCFFDGSGHWNFGNHIVNIISALFTKNLFLSHHCDLLSKVI